MEYLKDLIMSQAREKGICLDGFSALRSISTKEALVGYYVQNPDWCMERDFPSLQMLASEFSDCENKGVFVCKTFHGEVLNDRQAYIFHNCKGTIKVGLNIDKAIIPMLYIGNGCRLRIIGVGDTIPVRGHTEVPLYIFGKNDLSARNNAYVNFIQYKHPML